MNQLDFEHPLVYDIVELYKALYENSKNIECVRKIYSDISQVHNEKYERITAIASFEHIENLPEVVKICAELLRTGGKLCVSIPNEGRFLWHFAYTMPQEKNL